MRALRPLRPPRLPVAPARRIFWDMDGEPLWRGIVLGGCSLTVCGRAHAALTNRVILTDAGLRAVSGCFLFLFCL